MALKPAPISIVIDDGPVSEFACYHNQTFAASFPPAEVAYLVVNGTDNAPIDATISRELGIPLRFPGTPEAYRAYQVSAADLLADATVWAGKSESAQDDISI
jgi:hypothetical protein